MSHIFLVLSIVYVFVLVYHSSVAMLAVLLMLSLIHSAILPFIDTISLSLSIDPLPRICLAIRPCVRPIALSHIIDVFAPIYVAVSADNLACSVLFALSELRNNLAFFEFDDPYSFFLT